MIRCAECNEENMDGLEYCDSCGAKLEAVQADDSLDGSDSTNEVNEDSTVPVEEPEETGVVEPEASENQEEELSADAGSPVDEVPAVAEEATEGPTEPGQEADSAATLTITRGGTIGKVFALQAGDNVVGRWDPDSGSFPEVDMENDDPEARISRKHALIKHSEKITIEDIGSMNGTFVNRGERLEPGAPVELEDGDEIIIGKTFLKISVSS